MADRQSVAGSIRATITTLTITTPLTASAQPVLVGISPFKYLAIQAKMAVGTGGTSIDAYIQTSLDNGLSWFDIANFHFLTTPGTKLSVVVWDPATPFPANTTPGSAALTANTVLNGVMGDRIRALVTTVGTYSGGTTLGIDVVAKG